MSGIRGAHGGGGNLQAQSSVVGVDEVVDGPDEAGVVPHELP
jgi:homospermidine synthase